MKKIMLVLLLASAWRPAPAWSLEPYASQGLTLNAQEKEDLYWRYAVESTRQGISTVDGQRHSSHVMRRYYEQSKAEEALELADEGAALQKSKKVFFFTSLGTGLGVGLVSGLIVLNQSNDQNQPGDGNPYLNLNPFIYGVGCALGFTALGTAIGGIGAIGYNRRANSRFKDAGEAYNQSLWRQIKLDVAPQSGGAKAGASLRF